MPNMSSMGWALVICPLMKAHLYFHIKRPAKELGLITQSEMYSGYYCQKAPPISQGINLRLDFSITDSSDNIIE